MPLDRSKPAVNVTRYATFNADVSWAGSKIAFFSQRRNSMAVHVLSLQKPSHFAIPRRRHRRRRAISTGTTFTCGSTRVGPPASRVIDFQKWPHGRIPQRQWAGDLWAASVDGGGISRLTTGTGASSFQWTKGGSIYFLDARRRHSDRRSRLLARLASSVSSPSTIHFTAKMSIDQPDGIPGNVRPGVADVVRFASTTASCMAPNWKAVREKYRASGSPYGIKGGHVQSRSA